MEVTRSTITLRKPEEPPKQYVGELYKPKETVKPPAKKDNQIDVTVHLDGKHYEMSFQVSMSNQLMSGQKNSAYMTELFSKMLMDKFGKATKL